MSAAEKNHFDAIAQAEKIAEDERIDAALVQTPGERILEGLRLAEATAWSRAHLAELDAQTDGQMNLARRRIALGLCESDD